MSRRLALGRDELTSLFSRAMSGQPAEPHPWLGAATGTLKTTTVEVNLDEESADGAMARLAQLGKSLGLDLRLTEDDSIALLRGDAGTLVVDVLDARFWLVHTIGHAEFAHDVLRSALRRNRDLDWCWFPRHLVEDFRTAGDVRWFKTDFEGDELTPSEGQRARRLRVQLDGDRAYDLLRILESQVDYRHAASLTALAVHVTEPKVGHVLEIADYKGRFAARGDSFEIHVGLVSNLVRRYSTYVRELEQRYALGWTSEADGGASLSGEVIVMPFRKTVDDMDRFLAGLFSCREPFRLWGVPRRMNERYLSVQAVDLHVGAQLPMDVSPDGLRIYLHQGACGNTVTRLLANLQHRYDATLDMPQVSITN